MYGNISKIRKQKELIVPQKTVSSRCVGWETRRTVDKRLRRNVIFISIIKYNIIRINGRYLLPTINTSSLKFTVLLCVNK